MSYSDAVKMSEDMKQFLEFQAFKKLQAGLNPQAPVFPPADERMRTAYQTTVKDKVSYQEVINSKKELFKPFDPEAFLAKAFHRIHISKTPENNLGRSLMVMLRSLVELEPERLNVIGGIHNNDDGTKTYLTASVKVNEYVFHNLHFYGVLKGNFFSTRQIGIILFGEEIICLCEPPPPQPARDN